MSTSIFISIFLYIAIGELIYYSNQKQIKHNDKAPKLNRFFIVPFWLPVIFLLFVAKPAVFKESLRKGMDIAKEIRRKEGK